MPSSPSMQRGGFVVGMVVGLLIGLALALGVALYVTKVPVPFIDKVPHRTPEQDAAEVEKNRNWDPNTGLYGKNPARPAPTPLPAATAGSAVLPPPDKSRPTATTRDPAAILGDIPASSSTNAAADAFVFYVQAGAYARTEEAEAQRAKLAIQGFESKITEREQAGRTMYRVRIGPFNQRGDAESVKATLDGSGTVAALVRVQK